MTDPGAPRPNSSQRWSVNLQLLWKILVYPQSSKSSHTAEDILGPGLSKDSMDMLDLSSAAVIAERDFSLIGSAGLSGHKTVAPECVTYPPEQAEHSGGLLQTEVGGMPSVTDTPALPEVLNSEFSSGETLFLQLQDYDKAFEDWLSLNPS